LKNHTWPGNIRELANVIERSSESDVKGSVLRLADQLERGRNDSNANLTLGRSRKTTYHSHPRTFRWIIEGEKGGADSWD
jgi:transcriptional regulator with PAS, ATPase and Fis domain